MAATDTASSPIRFQTHPDRYKHWKLAFDEDIATLTMAVDPFGGHRDDYELKLNSYDMAVDVELADAVQRIRFEHPEVRCVVLTGSLDRVFCAGANIVMLRTSTHAWKVNFCKFTNETRLAIGNESARDEEIFVDRHRRCQSVAGIGKLVGDTFSQVNPAFAAETRHGLPGVGIEGEQPPVKRSQKNSFVVPAFPVTQAAVDKQVIAPVAV
jgi:hypothetical protein